MTVKEIALVSGCNRETVLDLVKKKYPEIIKNGKTTKLNYEQSKTVMELLPKKNYVQPMESSLGQPVESSLGQPVKNEQVQNGQVNAESQNATQSLQVINNIEIIKSILEPFLKQQNEFNLMLLNEIKSIKQEKQEVKLLEKLKDRADYIGEKIAEQIRAKQERKENAQKIELYLFEIGGKR